jgi:hypothetical protein
MLGGHGPQSDGAAADSQPAASQDSATAHAFTGRSCKYPDGASMLVAAMRELALNGNDVARALGSLNGFRTMVASWCGATKSLSLDTILNKFPPALAERVLTKALDHVRERAGSRSLRLPATHHAMRAATVSGEFAALVMEAQADGRIDEREATSLRACAVRLEQVGKLASLDVEASR